MSGPYTNVEGSEGTYRITVTAILPNVGSDPSTWDLESLIEYLWISDAAISAVTAKRARWENPSEGGEFAGPGLPCDRCGEPTAIEDHCGWENGLGVSFYLCPDCYGIQTVGWSGRGRPVLPLGEE